MLLNSLLVAGSILLLAQIVMLWRFSHVMGTIRRYEERLGHLGDTMTLLTETTESGFRAMALEIERLATADAQRHVVRPSSTRIASAARRGRSIQQIAADEQVSEGEVRLRLHLNDQGRTAKAAAPKAAKPRAKREREHGHVRAD
jgi:hypothetical protein